MRLWVLVGVFWLVCFDCVCLVFGLWWLLVVCVLGFADWCFFWAFWFGVRWLFLFGLRLDGVDLCCFSGGLAGFLGFVLSCGVGII